MAEKGKYPNSGILSRNQRRESDKHPEYSGTAEVDGVEYWLSAWVNNGDNGKYFKISFKKKEPRQGGGGQSQGRSDRGNDRGRSRDDDDDYRGNGDVPF